MITVKQLNELIAFRTPNAGVLSAYFELEPADDAASLIRRLQRLSEGVPGAAALREDLERFERFLAEDFEPQGARTLALFSSKQFGLWRACYLPEPVKTSLSIAERASLKPLLAVTDQHHRFGVALVDERSARFFEVFLGRGREYPEHTISAAAHADAAAFAKAVADHLEGLARNQGFARVVVGVADALSRPLLGRLNSRLQRDLIVDSALAADASVEDVAARIASGERDARKVKETVLAHRLVDAARTTRAAVLGLEPTLAAFAQGRVKVLLVRDGFAKMGRSCSKCGELSIAWSKCVSCNAPTHAVFNLVAEMVARALERGCEVVRLLHETPLDNVGRIGAELAPAAVKQTISAADAPAAASAPAAA